jgi:hypothetical protein
MAELHIRQNNTAARPTGFAGPVQHLENFEVNL